MAENRLSPTEKDRFIEGLSILCRGISTATGQYIGWLIAWNLGLFLVLGLSALIWGRTGGWGQGLLPEPQDLIVTSLVAVALSGIVHYTNNVPELTSKQEEESRDREESETEQTLGLVWGTVPWLVGLVGIILLLLRGLLGEKPVWDWIASSIHLSASLLAASILWSRLPGISQVYANKIALEADESRQQIAQPSVEALEAD